MSQLTLGAIATQAVAASPTGLVRTSNVVTCTLSAGNPNFIPPVATINGVSVVDNQFVTLTGSTSVNGNDFNGSFLVLSMMLSGSNIVSLTWAQNAPNDTGGGGTLVQNNGFCDLPDSLLSGGSPFSQALAQRLLMNAKFACVRVEEFELGFWQSGAAVPVPISRYDGYVFSRAECQWKSEIFSSRQPAAGFVNGQTTVPTLANSDIGTGNLLMTPQENYVDPDSGVLILTYYFSTTNTPSTGTAQGTAKVKCTGQRMSVNPLA